ncbi:MAG: gamma-glutamyltransferase [Pseudomonadota bacterium]
MSAILAGCVQVVQQVGVVGRIGASSDVAQATDVGLEVLNGNGSAADAVVAMAFMMAVERPDQVGIAGGGTCLVFDPEEKATRLIDFPAVSAGSGAAIPGFLRGLAAVHADYGNLRWSEMVAIAETTLRFAPPGIDSTGRTASERLALADSLSEIRTGGIQVFYEGALGRRYAEGASAAGLPLTVNELRASGLSWGEPATASYGNDLVSFGPALGGRDVWFVDAFSVAAYGQRLPDGGTGSSGLVAVAMSQDEMAIACGFGFSPVSSNVTAGDTGIPIGGPTRNLPSIAIRYNEPVTIPIDVAGSTGSLSSFASVLLNAAVRGETPDASFSTGRVTGLLCPWDRAAIRECRGVADPANGGYGLSTETLLR